MYVYVKSLVRARGRAGRWTDAALGDLPVLSLWDTYSQVWLGLTHPTLEGVQGLDLNLLKDRLQSIGTTITVNEWLASLGNQSLPTVPGLPVLEPKYAEYRDAHYAGYNAQLVHRTANKDSTQPRSELWDALMTRKGVDYEKFERYCLVTVNGLYHRSEATTEGIHIYEGGRSAQIANDNQIGIHSFEAIGSLEVIDINASHLYLQNPDQKLGDRVYLNFGRDFAGKTVFLVLGGYLQVLDQTFKEVGEGLYRIDFSNLPWLERFYESQKLMDLSSLTKYLTEKNGEYSQVVLDELYSDSVIKAYLELLNTFLVVVDAPDVFVEFAELETLKSPGRYLTAEYPIHPLVSGVGRTVEYWPQPEAKDWVLITRPTPRINYTFDTAPWQESGYVSVNPNRDTVNPLAHPRARFRKIGRDL